MAPVKKNGRTIDLHVGLRGLHRARVLQVAGLRVAVGGGLVRRRTQRPGGPVQGAWGVLFSSIESLYSS